MNKFIYIIFAALIGMGLSTVSFANYPMGPCHCHMMNCKNAETCEKQCRCMPFMAKFADKLKLTDSQKKQMAAIQVEFRQQMKGHMKKMMDIRHQMRDLIQSDKLDQAKMDKLIKQKMEMVGKMTKFKMTMRNKMYNVLDANQKTMFKDMMQKMHMKRMEMHKKMMDMMGKKQ